MPIDQKYIYREWQYPRLASFLPLLLFIPAIWLVGAPLKTDLGLPLGIAFTLVATLLKLRNAKHIKITKEALILGDAVIPKSILGKKEIIGSQDQFFERGARLDSRAFVFLKYGLPGMVKIEINDPSDPTPYVLISSRSAAKLIESLD